MSIRAILASAFAMFLMMGATVSPAMAGDSERSSRGDSEHSSSHKVDVCHNGNTLNIDESALRAHLAHGDSEGQCRDDKSSSKNDKSSNNEAAYTKSASAPLTCQCGVQTPLEVAAKEVDKSSHEEAARIAKDSKDKADKDTKDARDYAQSVNDDKKSSDKDRKNANDEADRIDRESHAKADQDARDSKDKADKDTKDARDAAESDKNSKIAVAGAACTCPNGSTSFWGTTPAGAAGAAAQTSAPSAFREVRGQ